MIGTDYVMDPMQLCLGMLKIALSIAKTCKLEVNRRKLEVHRICEKWTHGRIVEIYEKWYGIGKYAEVSLHRYSKAIWKILSHISGAIKKSFKIFECRLHTKLWMWKFSCLSCRMYTEFWKPWYRGQCFTEIWKKTSIRDINSVKRK